MGVGLNSAQMGNRKRADGNCIRCIMDGLNLGDLNRADILNVLDIIATVNLILEDEFDVLADLNNDSTINMINIILE